MINNWDIISSFDAKSQSQRFTLVIDGTEHDARLVAKKLAGYAKPPQPAVAPFVYSFELPDDLDEDTLRKIQNATKEGIEQAKKVNEFVPGGVLGNTLFTNDVLQEDKAFPTFLTLDPSESFFKATGANEIKANVSSSLDLNEVDGLDLQTQVFSGADLDAELGGTPLTLDTETDTLLKLNDAKPADLETDTVTAQTVAIPGEEPEAEPEELAPTATQKPVVKPEPVEEPAPVSEPEPVEESAPEVPKKAPPVVKKEKSPVAKKEEEIPQPVTKPRGKPQQEPAKEDTASLDLTDKDNAVKNLENKVMNQMPLDDIFSAETKYDMFLDLENQTLVKRNSEQREKKFDHLADGKDSLEESFNLAQESLKDQVDHAAEDINEVTKRITQKDLNSIKGASKKTVQTPPSEDTIQDPFEKLMSDSRPSEKVKKKETPPKKPAALEPESEEEFSVQVEEKDKKAKSKKKKLPPSGPLGKSINLDEAAPRELSGEEEPETERKPTLKKKLKKANPIGDYTVEPAESLPDLLGKQKTERYVAPAKPAGTENEPADAGNKNKPADRIKQPLDRTFNLETTISAATMRRQYSRTFRQEEEMEGLAEISNNPNPEQEQPLPGSELHNKAKKTPAEPTFQLNKVGDSMPENNGENNNEIQKIESTQPKMPKAPPPPPAPKPPAPAAPPTPAPQQPDSEPAPQQPESSTGLDLQGMTSSNTLIEKTKTIDHSIELPLSELKKHNWPLEIPLIPTFTLENMVMSVNRFAHATAISVIDTPGKLYNPLVLHGPPGTGKTHFLNAIGYALSKKFGQENIFITNGVRLSRGIQRYVMEGNIEKFETFVDSVKALLIDDIHLIAINEQNRVHISNLLNRFLGEQKQIIITSKYPPESLQKLEELIGFRLDSGWISELKPAQGAAHFRIVKKMLLDNGIDVSDAQMQRFFGAGHMTLGTVSRSIRRVKVLENLIFPNLPEAERSEAMVFEKLLATNGEDKTSAIKTRDMDDIKSIPITGNGEWGRIGFFYPQNNSDKINWLVFALSERAKELSIPGGLELAVRSSYSTENIISSAFKIANLCDNKKLKGAVILGPSLRSCDPSVRENFYDILTHMLEVMLIRCGIINYEDIKSPSTYVKILSELLR